MILGILEQRCLESENLGTLWYLFQVTCNLLSVDGENDPDVASINAGQ